MKFTLALLALLVTISHLNAIVVPRIGSGQLATELQDFVDLLPVEEIMDLTQRYLARDREFQTVMNLMHSNEIKQYIKDLEAMPEFSKLMKLLTVSGLDTHSILKELNESLEALPVKVSKASNCKITGGFYGYTKDLAEILPLVEISDLFEYKVMMSYTFQTFVNECLSREYTDAFMASHTNLNFANAMQKLNTLGIDSETFHANFSYLLGIQALVHWYL